MNKEIVKLEEEKEKELKAVTNAKDEAKRKRHEVALQGVERKLAKLEFRKGLGEYFSQKKPEDIPEDLEWQNGDDVPPMGDPQAKKGGTLNTFIMTFPATVRRFGANSNNSFRSEIYDNMVSDNYKEKIEDNTEIIENIKNKDSDDTPQTAGQQSQVEHKIELPVPFLTLMK